MYHLIKRYFFEQQDQAYLDWLYSQNKRMLVYGLLFTLISVTSLSFVDYFYWGIQYDALGEAQPKVFGINDTFRLIILPIINAVVIIIAASPWNRSMWQFDLLAGIVIFASAFSFFLSGVYNESYSGDDYAYDVLVLILFTQIILGLTFRSSFLINCFLVFTVVVYMSVDDIPAGDYLYTLSLIILLWIPVCLGMFRLEEAKYSNFVTLSHLQSAHREVAAQARKLKIKNEDLQQFAYASSHDLQEPLRSITNFVQILDKQLDQQLDAKQRVYMKIIVDSTKRMKDLIHAILEYSRIGNNKLLETFDCNEVLAGVLIDLSRSIEESGGSIYYKNLPTITGYKAEFAILIQNLISNALKFRQANRPPIVTISVEEHSAHFHFQICDNGIGIEQKYADKIFHLFSRLHSKTAFEGTGIGLTHSKKIVELHRGKIWVSSNGAEGTCFHFYISKRLNTTFHGKEAELYHAN
ncbi:MAG: ATP-binding protein [Bacteroidota bacterium]